MLVHGLNWRLFSDAIARALGFAAPAGVPYVSRELREIGMYSAVAAPVYLSLAGTGGLLRELSKLQGLREGPFLVLTPTGSSWSGEVEALARPSGGGHVALSSVLIVDSGLNPNRAAQPVLLEFERRLESVLGGERV